MFNRPPAIITAAVSSWAFSCLAVLGREGRRFEIGIAQSLSAVIDVLLGLLGSRSCSIMRVDEGGSCLRQAAVSGPSGEEISFPLAEHPPARCWAENRPSPMRTSAKRNGPSGAPGARTVPPLPATFHQDGTRGVILVEYGYLPKSLEEHRDLLALVAGQLSLAIENAYLYQEIRLMANHDALTGLANRRFFRKKLAEEMAAAGDEVLRFMARLLLEETGSSPLSGQTGEGHGGGGGPGRYGPLMPKSREARGRAGI